MYDRKWLELQIVRMAEKHPNRVRLNGWGDCSDTQNGHCIIGQISHDIGKCQEWAGSFKNMDFPMRHLQASAVRANDRGLQWGQIPKALGLVTGELPGDPPTEVVLPDSSASEAEPPKPAEEVAAQTLELVEVMS